MYDERRLYFNSIAGDWNKKVPMSDKIESLLDRCQINSGEKILDVGSGTGRLSVLLQQKVGATGQVVSVDFSYDMLAEANKGGRDKTLHFMCADVLELACVDNCFDKVICYSAFPHFRDQKKALLEMHRVLTGKGMLFILHVEGSESLNTFHRSIGGAVGNDILPGEFSMCALLESSKFRNIKCIDQPDLYWVGAMK